MRISLCLLTWNELKGCKADVPKLDLEAFEEVFAMDGGSTDGTVEYLRSLGITVYQQDIKGYNGAYISAFRRCTTDALVMFHPKGSIEPADVLKFRPLFEQGNDLVVASRIGDGAVNEEDSHLLKPRKWFVMGLGLLARLIWKREGNTIWDVLHGMRGMRRDAFFAIEPIERGLSIDLEMVVRTYRMRLSRAAFPVREKPRLDGATHFKAFDTGKKLLKYMAFELRRPNKQGQLARARAELGQRPSIAD